MPRLFWFSSFVSLAGVKESPVECSDKIKSFLRMLKNNRSALVHCSWNMKCLKEELFNAWQEKWCEHFARECKITDRRKGKVSLLNFIFIFFKATLITNIIGLENFQGVVKTRAINSSKYQIIVMGQGQVGVGSAIMVWVWISKISPKNVNFFQIFSLRVKKNCFGSGQKVPGSKPGWPLIYCGVKSKLGSGRVGSGPISIRSHWWKYYRFLHLYSPQ